MGKVIKKTPTINSMNHKTLIRENRLKLDYKNQIIK